MSAPNLPELNVY